MNPKKLGLGVSAAVLALGAVPLASAQDDNEIVVTARRVEENIQSVPVSVAAFSAETLDDQVVTNLGDITRIVPAVRFVGEGNVAGTSIQMRGLGAPPVGSGGAAVVLYTNDVPGGGFGATVPTYDLANLQVLRGPQGTLFGRNTLGGAVLVNTQQPDFEQNGYVRATVADYGYYALEGAGNITIVPDRLAIRIGAQQRRGDGFTETNETPNIVGNMDDVDTQDYRVSVLFEPTSNLRNVLFVDHFEGHENGAPTIAFGTNPLSPFYNPNQDPRRVNYGPNPVHWDRELLTVTNTTYFDITDTITIKNIFGYRDNEFDIGIDSDGGPIPAFNPNSFGANEQITNELQVLGTAFGGRMDYILGAFYSHDEPTGPFGLIANVGPIFIRSEQFVTNDSRAVFANSKLELISERLWLNTGFRYTWDEQDICAAGTELAAGYGDRTDQAYCNTKAGSGSTLDGAGFLHIDGSAPTWSVGLDFQATDDLFFYIASRRGYRSAGANTSVFETACTTGAPVGSTFLDALAGLCVANPFTAPSAGTAADGSHTLGAAALDLRSLQYLEPETLTDIEIGMRAESELFGWRQRLNLTAYRYVYENVTQLLQVGPPALLPPAVPIVTPNDPGVPGFGSIAVNAGEVHVQGVEMDLMLQPTNSLTFNIAAAYTNQDPQGIPAPPPGFAAAFAPVNLPTPKWATTVAVAYVLPFRPLDSELTLNADYFYTSTYQSQSSEIPGYEVSNARLEWADIAGSGVTASFFVRNLFDQVYRFSTVQAATVTFNIGEPRMVGADLTYRF